MRTDIPTIPHQHLLPTETPHLVLPRAARNCYELFADVERWPEWLPGLTSVRTLVRTTHDRACEAALVAHLGGHKLLGRLGIAFSERVLAIGFRSPPEARLQLAGAAQFRPAGDASCMALYRIELRGADPALPSRALPDARALMAAFARFAETLIPRFPEGSAPHERPRDPTAMDMTGVFKSV